MEGWSCYGWKGENYYAVCYQVSGKCGYKENPNQESKAINKSSIKVLYGVKKGDACCKVL